MRPRRICLSNARSGTWKRNRGAERGRENLTMTLLGKILVLVNLVFSLLLATFALAVSTNRIDWAGTARGVSPEESKGEYNKKREEVTQQQAAVGLARSRWQTAFDTLPAVEQYRQKAKDWYQKELENLVKGDQPVKEVVYKDGRIQFDQATGFPQLQPLALKPNLPSAAVLRRELEAVHKDIEKEI